MRRGSFDVAATVVDIAGLDEEGLFRLTAGSSKVRRLRAEIEAGQVSLPYSLDIDSKNKKPVARKLSVNKRNLVDS